MLIPCAWYVTVGERESNFKLAKAVVNQSVCYIIVLSSKWSSDWNHTRWKFWSKWEYGYESETSLTAINCIEVPQNIRNLLKQNWFVANYYTERIISCEFVFKRSIYQ